ncbi:multidrug efflux system outer membrane protein [Panacagrimonas perspica]|uniref:Multidrug efflux system outer membrane protein n=1 Tax=Panacagrimonas perspica TaxID=381431 RepID=A0A4S3K4H8_9GAMM|nr:TolC family protein [Panacagrimonas perspica]TDU31812.1 multidrug efflux system outer membrane protein [Panacagrimonas perspica]THD02980.1 RND transporter [Panacagrimonas perspica]
MKNILLYGWTALLLSACAVGPDYREPDTAPAVMLNASYPAFVTQSPEAAWWSQFDDATLNRLVTTALSANLDLRIALDRVRAARAVFGERQYDLGPHVPIEAGYSRSDQQQPGLGSTRVDSESARLGFDASWELDLFGHVRRSIEAAQADVGVQEALLRDVQITVAAEVARNYFELRGVQKRVAIARRDLDSEAKTLELTQLRFDAGRVTALDVQRSRARLKSVEASIPLLDAAQKQGYYRLAVLLGERPGALDAELAAVAAPAYAKAVAVGDLSDVLRRRPDVRAAERELAAATARVGVATADLFPKVSITGFVGFLSGDIGQLFDTGGNDARAWSVAPTVRWAALDMGSVRARLRASEALSDVAATNYEKAVLSALEDTENRFVAYASQQARLKSLSEQAAASRIAAELAAIQYREGVTDFLVLLDAQRTQLEAEDAVAQAEAAVNVSVTAIYKALGGLGQS